MSDKVFPKGQIALGNGTLKQVTNIRHRITNNGKLIHTLARSPAGTFKGNIDTELSFDAYVDEDGYERDYFRDVVEGRIKQFRIKVPGETIAVTGINTERSVEIQTDDGVKYSVSGIGRSEVS